MEEQKVLQYVDFCSNESIDDNYSIEIRIQMRSYAFDWMKIDSF